MDGSLKWQWWLMAVFEYKGIDLAASAVTGTIVADTPRQARDRLRERGLTIQQVRQQKAVEKRQFQLRSPAGRGGWRVTAFVRELATLLGVGIPLLEAIDTIARQYKGSFAASMLLLRDRVSSGASLAEAMRDQPAVFDELTVQIAEVGENAGNLDEVLERLAEFKERSAALKNRIGTALLYPAIVLMMALGVSLFLMSFVVPQLLSGLLEAGRPLPLSTRIVKGGSDLLLAWWWLLLLSAGGLGLAVTMLLRTERGSMFWHRLQLRIPIVGELIRKQAIVRIAIVTATLLRSGIVFVKAIQIAQRSCRNKVLKDALHRCEQAVSSGRDIAVALEATGAFPPMVVQIFATGQQSGRLEEMLERLAKDYDQQVALASQRLAAVLEPLLILFLVLVVGLIAFATVLPILEAGNVL
jgi:general secretion pathway protein F